MAAQHTPRPWSVEGPDDFGDYNIHCPAQRAVVSAVISNLRYDAEALANARLTAAAPDLLAALVTIEALRPLVSLKDAPRFEKAWADVRAAIAKASGTEARS